MKQIYANYQEWEDYQNGMYSQTNIIDKDKKVFEAIKLLSDPVLFYNILKKIIIEWKVSSDVNLSNKSINRRAWLGAAACCYYCKCPEYLTRIAWGLLNKNTQDIANNIAEKIIKNYETKNNRIHNDMGEKMLF
jgi:hypothetical protein